MTDTRELSIVKPLFYDVLSGEFVPATDPTKRKHTLGRLAFAAVQKGEALQVEDHRRDFEYEPSWAPGILVTAACSHVADGELGNREDLVLSLVGIDLVNKLDNSSLTVMEDEKEFFIIENEMRFPSKPLELGPNIARTRRIITLRAHAFFEND